MGLATSKRRHPRAGNLRHLRYKRLMPPLAAVIRLLRPHQWVKNAFLAAPLFFTPSEVDAASVTAVALGFVAFCLVSSGVYVVNDLADRESDRLHPAKRTRPIAAGQVGVPMALVLAILLVGGGGVVAVALSASFASVLGVYLLLNLAYSLRLKHVAIVDVLLIAAGFVLRVEGGAALAGIVPTPWIIIMTGLLALFLALAKRRDDLVLALNNDHRRSLDGYNRSFLDAAVGVTLGALLVSYLVYTTDEQVMQRLGSRNLFYTAPFVVAGLLRYLQITLVEERSGAPTRIVLTDGFLIATVLGWIVVFAALIYS